MPIDIGKQLKLSFGKTDVRMVEPFLEQIPKLEKDVETCEVNSLRLIRSATLNNCRAMVAGDISQQVFEYNQGRISKAIEKFADRCVCKKFQ